MLDQDLEVRAGRLSDVAAISDDGVVTASEAELLPCTCIVLRWPPPPLVA